MKKYLMIPVVLGLLAACDKEEPVATITKAEYNKIEEGMSIEKVKDIIGGKPKDTYKIEDMNEVEYTYDAEGGVDTAAEATVMFIDGKVDTVLEDGLLTKKTKAPEISDEEQEASILKDSAEVIAHEVFGETNDFNGEDSIKDITLDEDRLTISVYGKDNLSNNMIKTGMYMDITEALKSLKEESIPNEVAFDILFPLTDAMGNEKDGSVMRVVFTADTIRNINYDNFNYDNIPTVAESYWQHNDMK